jgi:hypothetical protein
VRTRVIVAVALLWAGCATRPPARVPAPETTLRRFFAAVRADDPAAARALLTLQLRAEYDAERFGRLWRDNRAELLELARDAARTDPEGQAVAVVTVDDGEEVILVLQDGHYRLAGGVLDAQSLRAPLHTVAALRRALKRQSLPALLRVLSRERQAAWLASFEEAMERTSDTPGLQVEVDGDEAVVRTSGGGEILLKREDGGWRVWDVR